PAGPGQAGGLHRRPLVRRNPQGGAAGQVDRGAAAALSTPPTVLHAGALRRHRFLLQLATGSGWAGPCETVATGQTRRPSAPTTASPSSLLKAPRWGSGRISSTTSEGRHRRVPSGVTTTGRLISTGLATIACSSVSSSSDASSRPSSAHNGSLARSRPRTPTREAAASSRRRSRVGGCCRYSMTSGSTPLLRIIARVLREVPQRGLW